MKHVSDEELMDVLEGAGEAAARVHLEDCAQCAGQLQDGREALALARETVVPEPPPFYWETFRRQVGRRIDVPRASRLWWGAPLVAAATVAVVSFLPATTTPPAVVTPAALPAWSALPPAEEDAGLEVLQALGPVSGDAAAPVSCQDVAGCVASLSDEESRLLAEALEAEWGVEAL